MTAQKPGFDVLSHIGALQRYARSMTRGSADAEDLVHDALVRAYERRQTFRSGGNLRVWLLSILHNCFIDGTRSRKSEATRIAQTALLTARSIEAPQELSVRLAQVHQAFLSLPEDQRAALHLVTIEGLSYQEAADTLEIPLGTLMSRIGRGRSALREMEVNSAAKPSGLRIVGGRNDPIA